MEKPPKGGSLILEVFCCVEQQYQHPHVYFQFHEPREQKKGNLRHCGLLTLLQPSQFGSTTTKEEGECCYEESIVEGVLRTFLRMHIRKFVACCAFLVCINMHFMQLMNARL